MNILVSWKPRQKEEALKKEKHEEPEKEKGKGGQERRNSSEVTFFWHKLNSSTNNDLERPKTKRQILKVKRRLLPGLESPRKMLERIESNRSLSK